MPEYLAPGVYVEEVSFRSKSIEGVSTTTTGLIGPCRYGPVTLQPDVITSLGEFALTYGNGYQMEFVGDPPTHNYLWHGVRAFFEEGGKRLYISRVFRPLVKNKRYEDLNPDIAHPPKTGSHYQDGHGRATLPASGGGSSSAIRSRLP